MDILGHPPSPRRRHSCCEASDPLYLFPDIRQREPQRQDDGDDEEVSEALAAGLGPGQAERLVLLFLFLGLQKWMRLEELESCNRATAALVLGHSFLVADDVTIRSDSWMSGWETQQPVYHEAPIIAVSLGRRTRKKI